MEKLNAIVYQTPTGVEILNLGKRPNGEYEIIAHINEGQVSYLEKDKKVDPEVFEKVFQWLENNKPDSTKEKREEMSETTSAFTAIKDSWLTTARVLKSEFDKKAPEDVKNIVGKVERAFRSDGETPAPLSATNIRKKARSTGDRALLEAVGKVRRARTRPEANFLDDQLNDRLANMDEQEREDFYQQYLEITKDEENPERAQKALTWSRVFARYMR